MVKSISDDTIEISGKQIAFPCSIMKNPDGVPFIVEKDGLVIVNFYPRNSEESKSLIKSGTDMETNIWAFDANSNLVWKVSPPTVRPDKQNPYTSVYEKDGKVYGGNWCGFDFEIDLIDGSVKLPPNPGRPW